MRQVEVSRTLVFDAPRRARAFFEALIAGKLDIGRPANVEIIFKRHIRRDTPGVFRTAIDRPTVGPDTGGVVLNLFYKHSRIKQCLKDRSSPPTGSKSRSSTPSCTTGSCPRCWPPTSPGPARTPCCPACHRIDQRVHTWITRARLSQAA